MTLPAPGADGWMVSRRGTSPATETLFALADGVVGVRAGLEECRSPTLGAYMASVFEQTPIHYHERLPGFAEQSDTRVPVVDGTCLDVVLDGHVLGGPGTRHLECDWHLDLRTGVVTRQSTWLVGNRRVEVTAQRVMVGRAQAALALRYRIKSTDFSGPLAITSRLDTNGRSVREGEDPRIGANLAGGGLRVADAGQRAGVTYATQQTLRSRRWVAAAQAHRTVGELRRGPGTAPDGDLFVATLEPGQSAILEKFVAYSAGTGEAGAAEIAALCSRARSLAEGGFAAHAAHRRAELEADWQAQDIRVAGNDDLDRALRFNTFQLHQSASLDARYGTAAKGLTGEGYEGHAFWDTEAFILPAVVFTAPQAARVALESRIAQLDAARANARALNHERGALYPWRTIAGRECSAHYPSGSAQYHINAAIAQALELYATATGDESLLLEGGAEMLWETARLWMEVGAFSTAHHGRFCIFGVTGPDEYSALVDNNYYTNQMAALHLQFAARIYRELRARDPAGWLAIAQRLGLDDAEVSDWVAAADAVYLPYDAGLQIDAQDERFLSLPRLKGAEGSAGPLLMSLHPLTLYRHQISKQADLILAMVFAGDLVPLDRLRRNLSHYESVTTHDSTLSACAFSIVSSMAGLSARALAYFSRTARVDIDDLHANVAHGSHMASLAGSVMAVHWGFAGLRWRGGRLGFRPALPEALQGIAFRLRWRGRLIELQLTHAATTYRLVDGAPLELLHAGRPFILDGTVAFEPTRSAA